MKTLTCSASKALRSCGMLLLPFAFAINPASATLNCYTRLTSTVGDGMEVCISNHGNVIDIQSPKGYDHMGPEGYALSTYDLIQGSRVYYDFTNSEAGWGAETTSQPNGRNKLPLTITRSTTDGKFKLAQKFAWNPAEREITIEMKLTNTSGQARPTYIYLTRYFRPHIDGRYTFSFFARTASSILVFQNVFSNALLLTASGVEGPGPGMQFGRDLSIFPAETFNPAGGSRAVIERPEAGTWFGDGVGQANLNLPQLAPGATRTIKIKYQAR